MRKTTAEYSRISREKNKNNHKYRLRKLLEGARVRAKRYNIVCDLTLEDLIERESFFEDSALEDAIAYANKIINGSNRFKKEKQDGTDRTI